MDRHAPDYFAQLIGQAAGVLTEVKTEIDITPRRAILRLRAKFGRYQVLITELLDDNGRHYRYYVLLENSVEIGFDNAPDPRAIRKKYGKIGAAHQGQLVPHVHLENKSRLELTTEMTVIDFLAWLQMNLVF